MKTKFLFDLFRRTQAFFKKMFGQFVLFIEVFDFAFFFTFYQLRIKSYGRHNKTASHLACRTQKSKSAMLLCYIAHGETIEVTLQMHVLR